MSKLKLEILQREFFYNGTRIPDTAPNLFGGTGPGAADANVSRDRSRHPNGTRRYRQALRYNLQPDDGIDLWRHIRKLVRRAGLKS